MKKVILIMLFIIAAMSASCGGGNGPSNGPGENNAPAIDNNADAVSEEPDANLSDLLPDLDFNGKIFNILGMDTSGRGFNEYQPEEQTGEIIDDAVYNRNLDVEERFNMKINALPTPEGQVNNKLRAAILSGDENYHIYLNHAIDSTAAVLNGYLMDLNLLPHIDMGRPWWNQTAKENLILNGRMYLTMNDIATYSTISYVHAMFYNKNLARTFSLPDIYEIIKNGKWTLDELNGLIKDTSRDLNGDGAMDREDQYGFVGSNATNGVFLTGFNQRIMKTGADGYPELALNTERTASIVEKVYDLTFENKEAYVLPQPQESVITEIFKQGRALFYNGFICDANGFRDMDDDYGIVPMPKYDGQQDNYYTTVRGDNLLFGVPATVHEPDFEFTGAISEALSLESYKTVRPAVYDITLKLKGTRDDASTEILDIITSGIKLDFGFVFHGWKGFGFLMWNMLDAKSRDFASYYERHEEAVIKYYNEVIDIFKNLE